MFAPVPDLFAWTRMVAAIFSSTAQVEDVRDGAALGGAAHFGNLVNVLDVCATLIG